MPPKSRPKSRPKRKSRPKSRSRSKKRRRRKRKRRGRKPRSAPKSSTFPLEKGPKPEDLAPTEITRVFKIPSSQFSSDGDVILHNGYLLEEKLDAGGFGVIFFARFKKTNIRVACKLMELGDDWDDSRVTDMKNELFIMEKVKHLYVIRLYTSFLIQSSAGNRLFIFMQLADGGNFAKFCMKRGVMSEEECRPYMAQIVCGLNHMHSLGIAHRDIKLQNILLVTDKGSISKDFTLLLCDFGLSRILRHENGGQLALQRTCCGTPLYMSPELLLRKAYDAFLVDMWALGITVYIMMTLELPFDFRDEDAVIKDMVARKWSWPEDKMQGAPSEGLVAMTNRLLEPEVEKRMNMEQLCTDPWLAPAYKKAQSLANRKKVKS